MKLCFENLAKLLRVAYFPHLSSLCPASFCFNCLEDGFKTEEGGKRQRKAYFREICVFSSWEGMAPNEWKCERRWSMIPAEESNRKVVKFLTLPPSFHLCTIAQSTCKLVISLQIAGHRQAGKEKVFSTRLSMVSKLTQTGKLLKDRNTIPSYLPPESFTD